MPDHLPGLAVLGLQLVDSGGCSWRVTCDLFHEECLMRGWGNTSVLLGPPWCGNPTIIFGGLGEDDFIYEVETLWPGFGHSYDAGYYEGYTSDTLFDPFPSTTPYQMIHSSAALLNESMLITCGGHGPLNTCHGEAR